MRIRRERRSCWVATRVPITRIGMFIYLFGMDVLTLEEVCTANFRNYAQSEIEIEDLFEGHKNTVCYILYILKIITQSYRFQC
jgi:uncharacterized protein YqhQ